MEGRYEEPDCILYPEAAFSFLRFDMQLYAMEIKKR